MLDGDEEARLISALEPTGRRNRWMLPLVRVALETAMRRGELLSLRWTHVELDARVARLDMTKNGKPRTVPLSSNAVQILRNTPKSESGLVFPIGIAAMEAAFKRAALRAKVCDLHFHDLRHTATTRMATKLPNIIELAAVTGHETVQMLKRYYHPDAESLARKLD